jgi:hypothetical protein
MGNTGADLFAQLRHGQAAMRGNGAEPRLLVVGSDDAVHLDLFQDQEGRYYFAGPHNEGPTTVWGMPVVESRTSTDDSAPPLLLDPGIVGVLYLGDVSLMADPFSGFKRNLVSFRLEMNCLMHVRAPHGAYIVAPEPE